MRLRSFILCCVVGACFVEPVFANELKQLQVQAQSGQADAAKILKDINVYLQRSPDDFQALFLKARMLERNGRNADAKRVYRRLIKIRPASPGAYNNLARILVAEGDLNAAQALLEKAMRTHSGYATVYNNLNKIYVAMARDSYGKALQIKQTPARISITELNTALEPMIKTMVLAAVKPGLNVEPRRKDKQSKIQPAKVNLQAQLAKVVASPIATSAKTENSLVRNEIVTTLEGWAAAWSEQATDVYFIFYADDYHPPGISRSVWEKERRARLKKPSWIRIGLESIDVKSLTLREAKVELIQDYRASNYHDKTRKEFKLRQTADGWRIIAERNVAKIN